MRQRARTMVLLRGIARRLGVERPALALRRRMLPAHIRAHIRDNELLVALLAEMLEPDSDCLDVGAHRGSVLREMVRLAPRGRHIAWEPLPELATELTAEFPSVEVRQAALSDRAGNREFVRVVDAPEWSGFVERPTPGDGPVERINVICEVLDDTLPEGVRPSVVKIDVEGAEEEMLRGAAGTLARHRPCILFEHGRGSADYYGTGPGRIHDLLTAQLGYEIYGLDEDGPYDRERFVAIFEGSERVNFLARPTPQPAS